MKRILTILSLALAVISTANAQAFLDELRKAEPGKGTVTVIESKEIDDLVNGKGIQQEQVPAPVHPSQGAPSHAGTPQTVPHSGQATSQAGHPSSAEGAEKPESAHHGQLKDTEETVPPVIDTRKKVMRNGYKMQGYRIQVFSGGNSRVDRQKAEAAGALMKSNFPDQPIYVHFYSPSWKCRMGNYKTQAEAQAYLAKVRKLGYRQACIVKGTIQVQY